MRLNQMMYRYYLKRTMTSHVDYSGFVLSGQWQKTSGKVHRSKEIHVDLVFDYGIRLPFKFSKTHNSSIVHQIAELWKYSKQKYILHRNVKRAWNLCVYENQMYPMCYHLPKDWLLFFQYVECLHSFEYPIRQVKNALDCIAQAIFEHRLSLCLNMLPQQTYSVWDYNKGPY